MFRLSRLFAGLRSSRRPAQSRRRSAVRQIERLERREVYSVNPHALALQLTHSDEYYANTIGHDYQHYLGRAAEAEGLQYHVNRMKNGENFQQIESSFIGSPEYIANHGGTGEQWVRGMYQDLLGRAPDTAGLQYWTDHLANGANPSSVAYGFAASPERQGIEVQNIYNRVLGRTPGQPEVNYWVDQFQRGVTSEQIMAGFIGSPEYYNKYGQGNDALFAMNASVDTLQRLPSDGEYASWLGTSAESARGMLGQGIQDRWNQFLTDLGDVRDHANEVYRTLGNVLQADGPAAALAYLGAEAALFVSGDDRGQSVADFLVDNDIPRERNGRLLLDTLTTHFLTETESVAVDLLTAGVDALTTFRSTGNPVAAWAQFDAAMIGNIWEAGSLLIELYQYSPAQPIPTQPWQNSSGASSGTVIFDDNAQSGQLFDPSGFVTSNLPTSWYEPPMPLVPADQFFGSEQSWAVNPEWFGFGDSLADSIDWDSTPLYWSPEVIEVGRYSDWTVDPYDGWTSAIPDYDGVFTPGFFDNLGPNFDYDPWSDPYWGYSGGYDAYGAWNSWGSSSVFDSDFFDNLGSNFDPYDNYGYGDYGSGYDLTDYGVGAWGGLLLGGYGGYDSSGSGSGATIYFDDNAPRR